MKIIKRNGTTEELNLNKILNRIEAQSYGLNVDHQMIATKTIATLMDGVTSKEIDKQAAALSESYAILHPDYTYLAGRLALTALTKDVPYPNSPTVTWQMLNQHYKLSTRLTYVKSFNELKEIDEAFNEVVSQSKGHEFDYQGVRVMANQYSMLIDGKPIETPDLIRFRVAYYLGKDYGLDYVKKVFSYLREGLFTFATPININSGLEQAQLASCFLIGLEEDSYEGIQKTQTEAGRISKNAGGIGMHISNLRAKGTTIESSGAKAAGILPFAKLTEANANYWNQGGKRKGSYALYLEPWHADVFDFLELKSNQGLEANRCRDLFYAMWIPDLFMEEVEKDGVWYLFCPKECPGLSDVYGAEFKQLYLQYVAEGKHRKVVKARELWDAILHSQIEVGMPFLLCKDTVNEYSMQKNIGTVKSSNLCCVHGDTQLLTNKGYTSIGPLQDKEVTIWNGEEWSDVTVRKTGNSQQLMKIKTKDNKELLCTDYHKFPIVEGWSKKYTMVEAKDLKVGDRLLKWTAPVIEGVKELDHSHYNTITAIDHNHTIADTYCLTEPKRNMMVVNGILTGQCEILEYSGPDETAVCNLANINLDKWNNQTMAEKLDLVEVIVRMLNVAIDLSYYPDAKTRLSNLSRRPLGIGVQGLAEYFIQQGIPYDSEEAKDKNTLVFELIYQLALIASTKLVEEGRYGTYLGWDGSPYSKGKKHCTLTDPHSNPVPIPVANSLLIALMPTVTTSQLLGNTESFEPITSNIYQRRGTVGQYTVVNRYLVKALEEHGLWTDNVRNKIIQNRGSVQDIEEIPETIKSLFKTVWEIKPKVLLDLAIGRQPYVDQAQSMNLFLSTPTKKDLTAMHFYSWKGKLKTAMYYLRSGTALNSKKV